MGFDIIATSRGNTIADKCKIIDFEYQDIIKDLHSITHIISTIPPDKILVDPVLHKFKDIIAIAPNLEYIGYLSATSVYGNHKGLWVDENTIFNIDNERAKSRQQSEEAWLNFGDLINVPTIIMRLSGIYGRDRNVLDKIKDGSIKYIYKEGQVFSRIHVDDIVSAIILSLAKDKLSNIYNLSDDLPSPQHEVIEYAAKLLNIDLSPIVNFEEANISSMMREFYMSSKRVSNKKVKQNLGFRLKYPTYREGLGALLNENRSLY